MKDSCCSTGSGPGVLPFLGRVLVSLIFIIGGVGKIFDFKSAQQALIGMGVVDGAWIYVLIGLIMELGGGILILLGFFTAFASYTLMIFLFPTTLIFHAFWNYTGAESMMQATIFLKNLTIYGALLFLISYGPGRWSLDAVRKKHP